MKNNPRFLTYFSLISLVSCAGATDDSVEDNQSLSDPVKTEETAPATEFTVQRDSLFQIVLPATMTEQSDLNADASLQYAYAEEVDGVVKEHYVLVMTDTKEELASYNLAVEFDAMSFSLASVESVVEAYDTYEILTAEPVIEKINGLDCVLYEIEAASGEIETYHMLAVFEGEKAFYQVLTWTLLSQKEEFKTSMTSMIESFREI